MFIDKFPPRSRDLIIQLVARCGKLPGDIEYVCAEGLIVYVLFTDSTWMKMTIEGNMALM